MRDRSEHSPLTSLSLLGVPAGASETPTLVRDLLLSKPDSRDNKPSVALDWPKISIVTCSFNQGAYLEQCIDSVLSQNYPNLEYIMMDGGSTDNSVEIIKKYARHFAYWQSQKDGGHWIALNEALKRTSGEVMGFINSDDMLHRKGLWVVGNVFRTFGDVEFVTGRRVGFDKDGKKVSYGFENQRWSRKLLLDVENFINPSLCVMQEGTYWRRSLWEKAGGELDLSCKYAFDFELWARFSRYAQLYTVADEIGGFRSHSTDQHSDAHRIKYLSECLRVIDREKQTPSERPELDGKFPPLITCGLTKPEKKIRPPKAVTPVNPTISKQYIATPDTRYPKVSIVTPSYNQAEFLEECIDSVLSQGWPNLEYVIMDGGSTDGSVEIIKKYQKYLAYWQSQKDGGQYAAINDGFKRTTGEIMAWLNADDRYHPNALQTVAVVLQKYPDAKWITGRPNTFTEEGEPSWVFVMLPHYGREMYLRKLFTDPYVQQESVFWRRSLWEQAGGYVDTKWEYASDLELWRRFFRHAQLFTVNTLLGGFRFQLDQKSQIFGQRYILEAHKILQEEYELFLRGEYREVLPAPPPILSV